MEYLEGETMADRLRKGALPLDQALKTGAEVAEALHKAHRSGVVHRDLKPGNIMLTKSGAKLMDFGLAKPAGPAVPPSSGLTRTLDSSPLTAEGTVVGTFQYMSPEQVEGNEADPRSDIFALGAVLYEMVTGKRAFEGKTTASVLAAVLERQPAPINSFQPMSPPDLDHAVKKCLAKDPEERWQSAGDLASQLRWIAEAGSQAAISARPAAAQRTRERALTAAAVLFALATIIFGLAYFRRPAHEAPAFRTSILPPENNSFLNGVASSGFALSPDGTRLAFVAQSVEGMTNLWVRPLNTLAAQALAGTENASSPFWSPDGQAIGFFAAARMKRIPAAGGPVQEICDAPIGRGGAWNAQGTIVFSPNIGTPLFRVSANGGIPVQVTRLDASRGETTHRWPEFLPDGQHFLYLGRSLANEKTSAVFVGSLDASPPRLLLETRGGARYAAPGYVLFVRKSTLMAQRFDTRSLTLVGEPVPIAGDVFTQGNVLRDSFDVSQTGQLIYQNVGSGGDTQLAITDRSGKVLSVPGPSGNYTGVRLSPDGQKAAVQENDLVSGDTTLWIYDLRTNVRTRFTFAPGINGSATWSPDGSQIAFASNRVNTLNIYVKPTTGAAEEKLLFQSTTDQRPRSWSPDGRYLAFEERGSGIPQAFVLPLFGDRKPFALLDVPYVTVQPEFSPDGRWLAYTSQEASRLEVYVTSFPDAKGKWQVSSGGGSGPHWRQDGRELFYSAPDGVLMAAEVSTAGGSFAVGAVKPLPGRRSLVLFTAAGTGGSYDVFPDGQRFIVTTVKPEAMHSPLTLVTNWLEALPR